MVLCLTAACNDREDVDTDDSQTVIVTMNVDVVLPTPILTQWQNSIDWAMENIVHAQQGLNKQVKLNLRYHDEYVEDLDQLAFKLTHPQEGDDTCHAIIGPYHSDNAQTFLSYAAQTRLPVVMPTCTSADLQRANAKNTYAWFLTESDITQLEMMFTAASITGCSDVALIYSNDTYGKSFYDWFAFFATEHNINVAGDGTLAYESGMDIVPFLESMLDNHKGSKALVFLALSDVGDYGPVSQSIYDYGIFISDNDIEHHFIYHTITSDTSHDGLTAKSESYKNFDYGICPVGSVNLGFPQTYEARYGHRPYTGEAQVYDALTLIALGAAHRLSSPDECLVGGRQVVYNEQPTGPGLTDYMRSVVDSDQGTTVGWTERGLHTAFSRLASKQPINVTGAIGNMLFDQDTRTKILNTTYMWWLLNVRWTENGVINEIKPRLYLSTAGMNNDTSSKSIWQMQKTFEQEFDRESIVKHELPPVKDRWAVIISPSTSWSNYRHQADAFAMYQTLRHHGYDDDHMVFIVEDNLADNPNNMFPGEIFVERTDDPNNTDIFLNDNVRSHATVDYHFSHLRPEDLADILMGRESERLPHVIHPTANSNVFLFWSGHGGSKDGPLWGNEDAKEYFGTDRIRDIVAQMSAIHTDHGIEGIQERMYRRMMLCIETCYSGKWGEILQGLPDVVVLTAANSMETSKADVFDQQLGVFLSNAFVRTYRRIINDNIAIPIYDLYRQLARTTNGSHVTLYNEKEYGSVYTETMQEFFPE